MQFNHFKSAIMLGLRIVSNISLAPAAVKCEAFALSLASASGQATSTNLRHGVWHPGFFCGPSTNSFSTAPVRCCLSAPAARGSQGPNTIIGHDFFTHRGLQHKYQFTQFSIYKYSIQCILQSTFYMGNNTN